MRIFHERNLSFKVMLLAFGTNNQDLTEMNISQSYGTTSKMVKLLGSLAY